jgi:hypothetical protein
MRQVEIGVEFGCGPYFADLDPAVIRGSALNKVGILPVFKIKRDVFKKSRLVVFDGKVVMSVTIPNQIVGDGALRQEGISGNVFALNINGIQQRNGGFDFVGTFEFFTPLYGEETDFFWV